MRRHFFEVSLLALVVASAPALAAPATGDGAKALAQSFAAYFGRTSVDQGIIAVAPQGDDYKVTVDIQHVLDGLGLPAGSVKVDAFSFLTTPQAGGTWKVVANAFPNVNVHMAMPDGEYGGSVALNNYKFSGVYDPKLATFLNATNTIDLIDVKWKAKESEVSLQETGSVAEFKGADAGGGAVNGSVRHTVKGLVENVKVTPAAKAGSPPGAPVSITYKVASMTSEGTLEAMRGRSIMDLWAYLVSLPSPEQAVEHQDELKSRVSAMLPLWNKMKVALTLNGLSAQLPFGEVKVNSFGETLAFSGLTPHGEFELGLKIDGPSIPAALLPPWSAPLLPNLLDADVKLSIEGLDKLSHAVVDNFDAKATPPLSAENQAKLAAMLVSGNPRLVLSPSRIVSPNYTLNVQGEMALTMPKPTGKFIISADGLDKTADIIQAAAKANPQLAQAVPIITFVKGLAKTGADGKPTWEVVIGADGGVTVNGQKMGK